LPSPFSLHFHTLKTAQETDLDLREHQTIASKAQTLILHPCFPFL
jgi:hypothetical protein